MGCFLTGRQNQMMTTMVLGGLATLGMLFNSKSNDDDDIHGVGWPLPTSKRQGRLSLDLLSLSFKLQFELHQKKFNSTTVPLQWYCWYWILSMSFKYQFDTCSATRIATICTCFGICHQVVIQTKELFCLYILSHFLETSTAFVCLTRVFAASVNGP